MNITIVFLASAESEKYHLTDNGCKQIESTAQQLVDYGVVAERFFTTPEDYSTGQVLSDTLVRMSKNPQDWNPQPRGELGKKSLTSMLNYLSRQYSAHPHSPGTVAFIMPGDRIADILSAVSKQEWKPLGPGSAVAATFKTSDWKQVGRDTFAYEKTFSPVLVLTKA